MIQKSFNAIDKSDIEALISNEVRESRTIDYKKELPGKTDDDKKELLADISSFANAGGGDLVFGIEEEEGIPKKAEGVGGDLDAEKLRIESLIRDGLQPRITGIGIKIVEGFSKGSVLIVRIPKSWNAPHMVVFKKSSRFFTRSNAGKYPMDVTEIRSAFLLSVELPEKIRRFRDERIGRIIANETPIKLCPGAQAILHMLPLASFSTDFKLDIGNLNRYVIEIQPIGFGGWDNRFNIDGFVTFAAPYDNDGTKSYCQLFRSGQLEAVYTNLLVVANDIPCIPNIQYENRIFMATHKYLKLMKTLDVSCPILIYLTMTGVKGVYMGSNWGASGAPIDRDILVLPDILVENYASISEDKEVAKIFRPIFDAIWNACGFAQSPNYNANGDWGQRR